MLYGVIGPRDFNGREYDNYEHVSKVLESFKDATGFIAGGSKGLEKLVERYCDDKGVELRIIPPNIQRYQLPAAFLIRNIEIMDASDSMIVFWDGGRNGGIVDILSRTMEHHKEVALIPLL